MSARVLVVDDDPALRRALSVTLQRSGFDVTTAEDAAPAIAQAEVAQPDIIVVDYNMPTCGIELVRSVRASNSNVFVAVLTGDDDDAIRSVCFAAGANIVMTKPVSPSELRRRLALRE
jgi:DNA-binding response OmpR family regulator